MRTATRRTDEATECRGGVAALLAVLALALLLPAFAPAAGITNAGSDLRDGWYGNQPGLSPDLVSGGTFGRLFSVPVDGQVYAQPLVAGGRVIVATERNKVYALDTETGATRWTTTLRGEPWQAKDRGCYDLAPDVGATATPVIDTATNTVYLTHKSYNSGRSGATTWWMDALDATTGAQRPGFPIALGGPADNAPSQVFQPTVQLQRPGLLLLDGVVYAAFGSVCDVPGFKGWVFGVATGATPSITARWVSVAQWDGAGIWQAGSGIMSDGPGRLFVATGNGGAPEPPLAGTAGNGFYGESVIRLEVQPDRKLKPADFFAPFDGAQLDEWDADFASGGVTALRDDVFGTAALPHLAMAVGKSGYLYLLNRDDLGGTGMGVAGGDRVVQRLGPRGGVWSRPGVWPGDGGWVYVPTASGGDTGSATSGYFDVYQYAKTSSGTPTLALRATSADSFGFGSSAPVITSDARATGSALVWTVWMPNGSGEGAQLRAYDALPRSGALHLRGQWPVGTASKFNTPGVGNGRIYVGTRDGHLVGFGAPVDAKVTGGSATFPTTTVGSTASRTVTLTASGRITITGIAATPSAFAAAPVTLPRTLEAGDTLPVDLTFTPSAPGPAGGTLTVQTDQGPFPFSLSGTGQAPAAKLVSAPAVVSFGGVVVGQSRTDTMTFSNDGGQPLKITGYEGMAPPFSMDDPPAAGTTLAPGASVSVPVTFTPAASGTFSQTFTVHSDAGDATVGLSGTAAQGPRLTIAPTTTDFGTLTVGRSATQSFTVANTGDTAMRIMKSKPPIAAGAFTALDALDEGTTVQPGTSVELRVRFTPAEPGPATDRWIVTADDGTGQQDVVFTGVGRAPAPPSAAPASVAFGTLTTGESAEQTVTFTNPGDTGLMVGALEVSGDAFALVSGPAPGDVLAPGASATAVVRFAPAAPGPAAGTVVLRTGAGDASVGLSGDAQAPSDTTPGGEEPPPDGGEQPPPDTAPGDQDPPAGTPADPLTPVPVGPGLPAGPPARPGDPPVGGTASRARVSAGLRGVRATRSASRRTLTVTGRLSPKASGTITVWVHFRAGRRHVTRIVRARAARGTFTVRFRLRGALRRAPSAKLTVRFGGDAAVAPQTVRTTFIARRTG